MATRSKTVEFSFYSSCTTTASNQSFAFPQTTLYTPETAASSASFLSAIMQVGVGHGQATACSIQGYTFVIKLGAAANASATVTDKYDNSGEHQSWLYAHDFKNYFNTNYGTSTSQTCSACFSACNTIVTNQSAKLILSYLYDDSSASTRIKTVKIPIESAASTVTAAASAFPLASSSQVPLLDTFLPETSKTYRDIWFEWMFNEAQTATTTYSMEMELDNDAVENDATHQAALNSSTWGWYIWKKPAMTTSASHQLKVRGNNLTARLSNIGAILNVTYEYNHSTTASILNSLWMPIMDSEESLGGTAAGSQSRYTKELWIEEASPITLKQSGILFNVNDNATLGVNVSVSASNAAGQTSRLYTLNPGSLTCGGNTFIHRIDSGASGGDSSIGLSRGKNTIEVDVFGSTASHPAFGFSGVLYLNYMSGKNSASGDGVHNHTLINSMADTTGASSVSHYLSASPPTIPETYYWINGIGYEGYLQTVAVTAMGYCLQARVLSSEGELDGWRVIGSDTNRLDGENALFPVWFPAEKHFPRYAGDFDQSRLSLTGSRAYKFDSSQGTRLNLIQYLTYHGIHSACAISGSVSSGASDVRVYLHRVREGDTVASALSTASGVFNIPWYDDMHGVYVDAQPSVTQFGRSASGLAVL